jgi:hypothetical protein
MTAFPLKRSNSQAQAWRLFKPLFLNVVSLRGADNKNTVVRTLRAIANQAL